MRVAAPDDGLAHADLIPLQSAFVKLAVQQTLYGDFMHHRLKASSVGSFSLRLTLPMTFEGFSTTVSRDCGSGPLMQDARDLSPSCRKTTIGSGGDNSAAVEQVPQPTRELTSFSNAAAISSISDSDWSNAKLLPKRCQEPFI